MAGAPVPEGPAGFLLGDAAPGQSPNSKFLGDDLAPVRSVGSIDVEPNPKGECRWGGMYWKVWHPWLQEGSPVSMQACDTACEERVIEGGFLRAARAGPGLRRAAKFDCPRGGGHCGSSGALRVRVGGSHRRVALRKLERSFQPGCIPVVDSGPRAITHPERVVGRHGEIGAPAMPAHVANICHGARGHSWCECECESA